MKTSLTLRRLGATAALCLCAAATPALAQSPVPASERPRETPLDLINALHTAFGDHHDRAVHTKGTMLEGSFTPASDARALTIAPIFAGGTVPVTARFSLFAGVPDLPDNDDGASPAGFAVKIVGEDGIDFDIEANQHNGFIVATSDAFALFLRAVGAAGKGDGAPLQGFLTAHPEARAFLAGRTYPKSFASAIYFGVNSVKFTNAKGKSVFVRYRFVPVDGEHYLSPEERKAAGPSYLGDEIVQRIGHGPIAFDLYAQIAEAGDKIEDPSIAWPESRKLLKLGTLKLNRFPADPVSAQKTLLFLPGQSHPGVEPADPMLVLRNTAYPISLGQRQ